MRPSHTLIASLLAAPIALAQAYGPTANSAVHSVAQYNLTWSSLGTSEKDSLPLGNGSLAANVSTEQNSDVVLLLSSPDAYTELGKLVKVGRVRLHFSPNVFAAFNPFTQVLRVDRSDIEMTSASNTVRIWIDANHPALHVEVHAEKPTTLTFYDQHYPRDSQDKLVMVPAQSLETYQLVTVTPTPDLAGLKSVLPRMIALPQDTAGKEQVAVWQKLLAKLPEVPVGRATDKGKTPPMGVGDPHGTPVILPAAQYGKTGNAENPELYMSLPCRLFGVDKPNLQLALDTYAARRSPQDTCWGQDGTEAAALGITDEARKAVVAEFTNYGDQRFQWFWKPAHDWIPDLDNGGSGMVTLEEMLLQSDGRKIPLSQLGRKTRPQIFGCTLRTAQQSTGT